MEENQNGTSIGSAWVTVKGELCKYLYERISKDDE